MHVFLQKIVEKIFGTLSYLHPILNLNGDVFFSNRLPDFVLLVPLDICRWDGLPGLYDGRKQEAERVGRCFGVLHAVLLLRKGVGTVIKR